MKENLWPFETDTAMSVDPTPPFIEGVAHNVTYANSVTIKLKYPQLSNWYPEYELKVVLDGQPIDLPFTIIQAGSHELSEFFTGTKNYQRFGFEKHYVFQITKPNAFATTISESSKMACPNTVHAPGPNGRVQLLFKKPNKE